MKFKLFISLSLLTAFFSMNASTLQVSQLMKHSILAAKESIRPCMKKIGTGLHRVGRITTGVAVGAAVGCGLGYTTEQTELYGEQKSLVDSMVIADLQADQQQEVKPVEFSESFLIDAGRNGSVILALNDNIQNHIAPNRIKVKNSNTFLKRLQSNFKYNMSVMKSGLSHGVNLAKTHKTASAVAGTVVVAGLGYMAYNKIAAKYAQAKMPVVTTSVVSVPVEKAVVKKAVKKSTPSRRNNSNRRK
ncbi:hypothetical protein KBD08_03530 [Candidatus Babeliales bacterium]|nr:hypothetical protein [Candidatus Babeliales bacterium]